MARNQLELFGYDFVENMQEADFLVAVSYTNEYKEEYIPPSSVTVPWHIPGQTQTPYINNRFNFSGAMGLNSFYGSGTGQGTATTTTPGYYVPVSVQRPGGYVGWYYPSILVFVFNRESNQVLWSGSAIVPTTQPDIRISGQVLISEIFGVSTGSQFNFPPVKDSREKNDDER